MDGPPGLIDWIPNLLRGLGNTMLVTVLATILMVVLAVILGLMARSRRMPVRGVARVVIEFFRGTSLPIQLLWFYFALPMVGFQLNAIFAGVLAFGLNYGAYGAEVVRGAINAVPRPQWEAATALNLSSWQRMTRVVWPQAIPLMIPAMNNLFIQLFKSTPLLFAITIIDVMQMGEAFRFAGGNSTAMYLLLMVVYFVIAYAVTFLMNLAEAAAKKRLGQHEGVRSMFRTRKPVPQEVTP
ncbi:amino acid ABC transporter permease [Prauserella muralis]|uniref:Ectoine/hydroxyectoine ABC transporter permease subunit EhuC n=2 Tax=Prauserella muralis TaxID=588067 RepID=A0A2V4AKZ0_9PSEU|nr:amino acid ABC transporter permease [Prauserella muralis]PXY20947.1 ectoine/hydroxyectoine ABC transporter permease subunit EhuC [Prauserella muralis]TWE30008.1 amino acid ABC transporter membrane protein 1 (PAAT family) [Prauserella muralis]